MAPETPQYIPPMVGPVRAGETGAAPEVKNVISFDPAYTPDKTVCYDVTHTNGTSYDNTANTAKPVDRGYYARTFGAKRKSRSG